MKLTNNARRRLGIPGRPAIILQPGETVEITKAQLDAMGKSRAVSNWLRTGILSVDGDAKVHKVKVDLEAEQKPEAPDPEPEGEGVEIKHQGGGWYQVYVNGFQVTDANVRKAKAEEIAAEYD